MQKLRQRLLTITSDDLIFYCVVLTFFLLPTGTAPPLIAIGLACLVWIFSGKIFQIISIVKQPWFYPVIPFVILPWIGLLYSQNLDLGMDYAMKTKYWVVLFITAGMVLNRNRFDMIMSGFWFGLLIGAVLAFVQFIGIMTPINELFFGFGVAHTLVDMYLMVGILMTSFYCKKAGTYKRRFFMIFLLVSFIFHLAVLSGRSGYLIFVFCLPLIINNLLGQFSIKIKMALGVTLICALLFSPVVREEIDGTMLQLNQEKEKILRGEDSTQFPRIFIIRESLKNIRLHPVIGIGTGSITESTKKTGHMVHHSHNNILYMGTSFGIFGIISCLWLFWKMFKISWEFRETTVGYFIFSSCLVLFLGGMFDTQILNTGTLILLVLSYGFLNHLKPSLIDCENATEVLSV